MDGNSLVITSAPAHRCPFRTWIAERYESSAENCDQQWDNESVEFTKQPEVRPPPVPACLCPMTTFDVARYGPTPECEYDSGRKSAESDEAASNAGHAWKCSCSVMKTNWCSSDCTQTDSEEARQLSKMSEADVVKP